MKQKDFVTDEHTDTTKNQVDRNSLDTCLSVCAFAASLIMAGTCDNECMQMLRALRKRFEQDMHYGFNQAINMSIGFLYLGSGAYTFSSSDMAIASLLVALYPVFPKNPSDNRYHLQALRHFYILAIETRLSQARDVDSGAFENVPVVATVVKDGVEKEERLQTPAILNGSIKQLRVEDPRFYGIQVQFEEGKEHASMANLHRVIYVKKRQGKDS